MSNWLQTLMIACASAAFGFLLSQLGEHFITRRKLIEDIADRYIAEARHEPIHQASAFRFGAMQRAGVALLKRRSQVERFFELVTARGCAHPLKDSDLTEFVPLAKLPIFLRAASERGISLTSDVEIYDFLGECVAQT